MEPTMAHAIKRFLAKPDGPLLVLCSFCIALGLYLRAQALGFPQHLTFDEHHFVENARNYLAHKPDWNDHPPLGKLIMALPMFALGDTSFAWRLAPLLFGFANVGLAYLLGNRLFRDRLAGIFAATFFAIDGFLLAYSRSALLDGMLTTTFLGTVILVATGRHPVRFLFAGLLMGCSLAIKVSGVILYGPLAAATVMAFVRGSKGERIAACAAWFLPPIVYLGWFSFGLKMMGRPAGLDAAIAASNKLFEHHAALTDGKNPLVGRWYTWFKPQKPILMRRDVVDGDVVRVMTSLGNPLLWWTGALSVIATSLWAATEWLKRLRARFSPAGGAGAALVAGELEPMSWLVVAHLSSMAPWVLTHRDSYIYHYLPSYAFGLVILAGWAASYYRKPKTRRLVLGLAAVAVVVSGFYVPVWAQLPMTTFAFEARPLVLR
jgi:dolichyl-phosphate-mannose--protein O-mannosyl transferase